MLAIASAIVLVMAGAYAWQWASGIMVSEIRIHGNTHAATGEILALARIDSSVAIVDVNPDSVSAGIEAHPWVKDAAVRRLPTGTVNIRIAERHPVAIVLEGGSPAAFLDATGRVMPLTEDAVYDVPTITGVREIRGRDVVEDETILELLRTLDNSPREISALIGDLTYENGEVWVRTLPNSSGESLPIRLGDRDFETRLRRMYTFWHRAVITQPEKRFAVIDLRFDSQVVTRESERER